MDQPIETSLPEEVIEVLRERGGAVLLVEHADLGDGYVLRVYDPIDVDYHRPLVELGNWGG